MNVALSLSQDCDGVEDLRSAKFPTRNDNFFLLCFCSVSLETTLLSTFCNM